MVVSSVANNSKKVLVSTGQQRPFCVEFEYPLQVYSYSPKICMGLGYFLKTILKIENWKILHLSTFFHYTLGIHL